mmetsp:Transcript_24472/g.39476  ORF Transcript_24472/g.39476 Transcript_24472/m.39476 type:complete len:236 (+) Transcript_24472:642-1349(+)
MKRFFLCRFIGIGQALFESGLHRVQNSFWQFFRFAIFGRRRFKVRQYLRQIVPTILSNRFVLGTRAIANKFRHHHTQRFVVLDSHAFNHQRDGSFQFLRGFRIRLLQRNHQYLEIVRTLRAKMFIVLLNQCLQHIAGRNLYRFLFICHLSIERFLEPGHGELARSLLTLLIVQNGQRILHQLDTFLERRFNITEMLVHKLELVLCAASLGNTEIHLGTTRIFLGRRCSRFLLADG